MPLPAMSHTTSSGSTVTVIPSDAGPLIVLDHPEAPEDLRNAEVGRVIEGSFQPAPFCVVGLRPEMLRAIADLIEEGAGDE